MTLSDLEHFRNLLIERSANLAGWLDAPSAAGEEDVHKAQLLLSLIKEALGRVDDHTFGTCKVCQEGVELHRLEVQPITEVCLGCISKQEQSQLEEELFLASKIHRALLPQTIGKIDGFEVAVKSLAARMVGGDYYDFLPANGNGMARVVIADVMGKGIPAGLLMSNVQGALRVLAEEIDSPRLLLSRLNHWICRNVPVTKFVSLACIGVETGFGKSSRLLLANAGHCPPLIVRSDGRVEELEPTGGVLGVHEGFDYQECNHELYPDDLILLYTDGVTEAEDQDGEMYGEGRLIEFVSTRRTDPLETLLYDLLSSVRGFSPKPELADDYTVIALRKLKS